MHCREQAVPGHRLTLPWAGFVYPQRNLQERKVSPPNLPTPEYFVPLGALLAFVRAGNKFAPVNVDDIRSGGWLLLFFAIPCLF